MESFNFLLDQLEPRTFNLTGGTGGVSSAYATLIILAISFAIAAIGGLLYYGLQNMATTGYGYAADQYNYQRFQQDYFARRSQDYLEETDTVAGIARSEEEYNQPAN